MKQLLRVITLAQATQEPTVASIPGILLRALMRTSARLVFLLAGVMFLLAVALFSFSLFLATFPSVHNRIRHFA